MTLPHRGPILALVGPTAVGKTALALRLAEHVPLEVVSADSRTVYRWMDIGTAKPSTDERRRVPHHLLDVADPDQPYSLAVYQRQALTAIDRIAARERLPALVGGAGLYVSAVCDGLAMPDVPPDLEFRAAMEARARLDGSQVLQRELERVDPTSAQRIEPRNVRRVIRALEVFRATGKPFSAWQTPEVPPVHSVLVGLRLERPALYARIDQRIDAWMAGGFVEEVEALLGRGYWPSLPSMSGIGYRQVAEFLRGALSLSEAISQFKAASHQYAKRQMTWFNRAAGIHWLDADTATVDQVLQHLDDTRRQTLAHLADAGADTGTHTRATSCHRCS